MSSNPTDNSSPDAPSGSMRPPPALSDEEKDDYAWKSWKPDTGVGDNVPLPPITEQQVDTAPSPSPSGWESPAQSNLPGAQPGQSHSTTDDFHSPFEEYPASEFLCGFCGSPDHASGDCAKNPRANT